MVRAGRGVVRREELLQAATAHVLETGVIGLTLRPLAAALGTSDRMLIYHFGSRDAMVSAVIERSGAIAIAAVDDLPSAPTVRSAVNRLWEAYQQPPLRSCLWVYLQAAATGLIGAEPYLEVVRAGNELWAQALGRYVERSGAPRRRVPRIVRLIDSALYGFHLDLLTDQPEQLARAVDDLARAAQALAEQP